MNVLSIFQYLKFQMFKQSALQHQILCLLGQEKIIEDMKPLPAQAKNFITKITYCS